MIEEEIDLRIVSVAVTLLVAIYPFLLYAIEHQFSLTQFPAESVTVLLASVATSLIGHFWLERRLRDRPLVLWMIQFFWISIF